MAKLYAVKHREAGLPKLDVPGMTAGQQSSGAATTAGSTHKKLFLTNGNSEV